MIASARPGGEKRLDAVRTRWQGQPFLAALDIAVEGLEEGHATLSLKRTDVTVGGVRASINGGVIAAYAELAARLALETALEPGDEIEGTVDLSVSYLSSARARVTLAEARLLRRGSRLCVCEVEVRDGESGRVNAKARVTNALSTRPREA